MTSAPVKTVTLRAGAAIAAAAMMLGMLSACTPEPEPTPTKTALFASEEEAFAAAEETYRAYANAVNKTDLGDTDSFKPVFELLTGTALEAERKTLSLYHAERLTRTGETTFDSFQPLETDGAEVVVNLCIDVSNVELRYENGDSAVPEDRAPRVGRKVTFTPGDTPSGLQITSNHRPDKGFTC